MPVEKLTFCRICEPACPMIAEIGDAGNVARLKPNPSDPIGGTPCHKGLSFLDVHNDPDRLNWPRKRLNPRSELRGEFQDVSWDAALAEIAARIGELRSKYGPNSVAIYNGNPFAFNGAALVLAGTIATALDTQMRFSANSQDAANRVAAASAVFGAAGALCVPDIYHTQYLLCLGSNPKVSRWTAMSTPNDPDILKNIRRRGGQVRFVNPRAIESSTEETGPTIRILPGTDVYFLAALIHTIHERGEFDHAAIAKRSRNIDGLIDFVSRYPAERVAPVTGIDAALIREIASEFSSAETAVAYSATGVNQSGQGVLGAWLVDMLNLVTGNLGRRGGSIKPAALVPKLRPGFGMQEIKTSIGPLHLPDPIGYGCLPAVVLPDLIEAGDIRALINLGGNPLLSIGGEEKLRAAFAKLDLLVSLDIYPSATAEMSDFALPSADWLERADLNLLGTSGMQTFPHIRYTEAMEPPIAGRRNDWWILARLAQELGIASPLDRESDEDSGTTTINRVLKAQGLTVDDVLAAPGQVIRMPDAAPDSLFERCVQHPDGLIDCCPEVFESWSLFDRAATAFEERLQDPEDSLRLISRRTPHMHNSWLSNSEALRTGRQALAPLYMCAEDAKRFGVGNGDPVRVTSSHGELETRIFIDDKLRPGVAAMSHGSGHRHAFGLSVAQRSPGANYNLLPPSGPETFEPLSNMSLLSGVQIRIAPLTHA
jgi:anaerobic selenocysteine-containing dehydrogenase